MFGCVPNIPTTFGPYAFVEDRTHDGRKIWMSGDKRCAFLADVIDEFIHECLAIRVARRLNSADVIDVLSDLFVLRRLCG